MITDPIAGGLLLASRRICPLLFCTAARDNGSPRPVRLFREPIHSADATRYLGGTLATHFTWSSHINLISKKANQTLVLLDPSLIRSYLDIANCFLLTSSSFVPSGGLVPACIFGTCKCLRIATKDT